MEKKLIRLQTNDRLRPSLKLCWFAITWPTQSNWAQSFFSFFQTMLSNWTRWTHIQLEHYLRSLQVVFFSTLIGISVVLWRSTGLEAMSLSNIHKNPQTISFAIIHYLMHLFQVICLKSLNVLQWTFKRIPGSNQDKDKRIILIKCSKLPCWKVYWTYLTSSKTAQRIQNTLC